MERAFRQWLVKQNWLDSVADKVQGSVGGVMERLGKPVTDVLHGTPIRHPLHPVLTDIPIGAWSVAAVLDALSSDGDKPRLAACADASLAIGLLGAAAAAPAGFADWRWVFGHPRRTGIIHGGLNVAAVLLNTTSLVLRLTNRRRPGVALSTMAYGSLALSGWLGGELVYENGLGVDHTAFQRGPGAFVAVLDEAELAEGQPRKVEAQGMPVMLLRRGDRIYAIAETCSHQGGPLSRGQLTDDTVTCPWHGSQFDVKDGSLVHGPATFDQPQLETRVRDGQIEVRLVQGSR